VQEIESAYNTANTTQQQYEFTCAKFDQKLKSAESVTEELIVPEQGLQAMQEHMTTLKVLVTHSVMAVDILFCCSSRCGIS